MSICESSGREAFQQMFQAYQKDHLNKSNQRLWEIDPGLVDQSRWGNGCIPNIFTYLANVFSRWWHQDEVASLQLRVSVLNQLIENPTMNRHEFLLAINASSQCMYLDTSFINLAPFDHLEKIKKLGLVYFPKEQKPPSIYEILGLPDDSYEIDEYMPLILEQIEAELLLKHTRSSFVGV